MTDRTISPRRRRIWRPLTSVALAAALTVPALAMAQQSTGQQSTPPASASSSAQQAQARQQMMQQMRQRMQAQMESLISRMNEPGVRSFKLDNSFLNKFVAVAKDARDMKNKPHIDPSTTKSADDLAKKLDDNAAIHKVLSKHDLSAKQYVDGSMALTAVMMKSRLSGQPATAKFAKQIKVSNHNMDYYKKNKSHIESMMKSMRGPAPSQSS